MLYSNLNFWIFMKKLQIWQNETHTPRDISQLRRTTAPHFLRCRRSLVAHSPHLACFTYLNYLLDPLRPDHFKFFTLFRRKESGAK